MQVNGKNVITPQPETEEYNVRNFIYSRRRPFHPERLMRLVYDKFILQLEHPDVEVDEVKAGAQSVIAAPTKSKDESLEDSADEEWSDDDSASDVNTNTPPSGRKSSADTAMTSQAESDAGENREDDLIQPPNAEIIENKRSHPLLGRLFRSKGIFWLATRPDFQGSWSQAGAMLALLSDRQWWCTLTEEQLSEFCTDAELKKQLDQDISEGGDWGDRRQEIVFIGEKLNIKGIEQLLDSCLLNDEEWKSWQAQMKVVQEKQEKLLELQQELEKAKEVLNWELLDGFPDWEAHFIDEQPEPDEEDEEDHAGHHHH